MLVNSHSDLLKTIHSDEFLPPINLWARLGGLLLVSTVGAAIYLASVIPYKVVVKAPATVRPSGEIRIVQAAIAGVVEGIVVQENQLVKQGDAIAYLEDSQLQTQKQQLQANIDQSQQQLTQIAAQIHALDRQQGAESNSSTHVIVAAQADLRRSQREYQENQISTQTQLQEAEADLGLVQEELKRYQQLARSGAIAQLQVKEKEQALKAALARRERTQSKVNPSNAEVTIASERIAQETARQKATIAILNQERESLLSKKTEIEQQLQRDRQSLPQLERDRQKSIVKATATGTLLHLELRNPGQVVHPGDAIAKITPSNSALVIKAHVAAQDISKVQICHQKKILECQQGKVQLRISAYPYPDYGILKGAVTAIATDITMAQDGSKPYYEVTIEPAKPFLTQKNHKYPLQAGMDVSAEITFKEETVLTFLFRKARLLTDL